MKKLLFVLSGVVLFSTNIVYAGGDGPAFVPNYPTIIFKDEEQVIDRNSTTWRAKTPYAKCPGGYYPVQIVDTVNPENSRLACAPFSDVLVGGEGSGG